MLVGLSRANLNGKLATRKDLEHASVRLDETGQVRRSAEPTSASPDEERSSTAAAAGVRGSAAWTPERSSTAP